MNIEAKSICIPRRRSINGRKIGATNTFRDEALPRGELTIRTWALPTNTNPFGNIFGGWIMSQMDSAGAIAAEKIAQGPVVTLAVESLTLLQPVKVGDIVCCYTDLEKIGKTSLCLRVEVWTSRYERPDRIKVTEGRFTFVAIDADGQPQIVRNAEKDRLEFDTRSDFISVPGRCLPPGG